MGLREQPTLPAEPDAIAHPPCRLLPFCRENHVRRVRLSAVRPPIGLREPLQFLVGDARAPLARCRAAIRSASPGLTRRSRLRVIPPRGHGAWLPSPSALHSPAGRPSAAST